MNDGLFVFVNTYAHPFKKGKLDANVHNFYLDVKCMRGGVQFHCGVSSVGSTPRSSVPVSLSAFIGLAAKAKLKPKVPLSTASLRLRTTEKGLGEYFKRTASLRLSTVEKGLCESL